MMLKFINNSLIANSLLSDDGKIKQCNINFFGYVIIRCWSLPKPKAANRIERADKESAVRSIILRHPR